MNINFRFLDTLEIISKNFNISLDFLECIKNNCESAQILTPIQNNENTNIIELSSIFKYYEVIKIPKRNKKRSGDYREVLDVQNPYNNFYKELLHIIELTVQNDKKNFINDIAHGFIKNRGILSNAEQHLNKKYILKIDIENFFNSITKDNIEQVFLKLGCNSNGAKLFSDLCTLKDVLQEGLNTSPILANLYCYNLDKDLEALAESYGIIVTRYSDDITFSSNENNFPKIDDIKIIMEKYHLKLNDSKTMFQKYGQSQYITGLSISNKDYPRVPRIMKRNIRQQLYYINKFPHNYFNIKNSYAKLRAIYGHIVYILGIEKKLGKKFKLRFLKSIEENGVYLENLFMDAPEISLTTNIFHYIDEAELVFQNKHYLALCVISVRGDKLNQSNKENIKKLKKDISLDFRNGLSDDDRTKLFHYCDNNILVKEKYISLLRELQFEAFIIFIKHDKNMKKKEYQDNFYKIFNKLMYNVLRRYKTNNNYIYVEENSKISQNQLEKNLLNIKSLPKFKIQILSKKEILLSIPDYVMGIFRDCMKKDLSESISKLKSEQKLKEENKLNEIIDKIRLVIDLENSKYYSRQNKNRVTCREINKSIDNEIQET